MKTHLASNAATLDTPRSPREFIDLPGPRGLPVLGNLLQIEVATIHQQVEAWAVEHGRLFRFSLGGRHIMVVGDHALVAGLLRDRPEGFRRSPRLEGVWSEMGLPQGLFTAEGEAWKRQRRMVMAGFDPAHVHAYFPSLLQVTNRLHGRWQRAAREGATIDLQADLMRFTIDVITGLAFGVESNTLESGGTVIQHHLDKIFPAMFRRVLASVPHWRYVRMPADRELDRGIAHVKLAIQGFIAQARETLRADPARRERPGNLLEAMLVSADLEAHALTDHDVAGNVLTMLLAGEDTTANTIAWMIHLLHGHPEALRLARDEVLRVAPDPAAFSAEQMRGLDVVEACAHETMRLKPVAPFLPFQALQDTLIGDVRVPAGTFVWALMRGDSVAESHFENAQVFEPRRWLASEGSAGASGNASASAAKRVSMPFGAGPRVCPGRYLALLEMKMAIAMLLGRFEIEHVGAEGGGPVQEHMAFTMAPLGLRMRLRERK